MSTVAAGRGQRARPRINGLSRFPPVRALLRLLAWTGERPPLRWLKRHQHANLPRRPPPSAFAIGAVIGVVAMTAITAWDWRWGTGFSPLELFDRLERPNPTLRGLASIDLGDMTIRRPWGIVHSGLFSLQPWQAVSFNADLGQLFSDRTRARFLETLRMAVLATVGGGLVSLPLALWTTRVGNPNILLRGLTRTTSNVIRAIPDIVYAILFAAAVSRGVLPGVLALFFFSIAVTTKLTSDTLDGIDMGPVEAAHASGAGHTQMLRSAVVPQILPAYSSFLLYSFELNLRASTVLGFVGAGGIGQRLNQFYNANRWEELWGIVILFFIIVFVVERISHYLRRRLL